MTWKLPKPIKIYEALGAVAAGRVKEEENEIRVYNSSGEKYYIVSFDQETNSIYANDNASYWQGYLGYPSIAFLFTAGLLKYRDDIANYFKEVNWKKINEKYKRKYDMVIEVVLYDAEKMGGKRDEIVEYIDSIMTQLEKLNLQKHAKRYLPPK
ncbi:MAG: hypothetical protein Q9M91_03300 [Candidatus Dojkabacteria bacterium]|nr:hypothetical protein [Candidatus Dojkabacteria bacterium]MDQ7020850.1 hypothetical protein [Candidatus Dojkabacteria bacterium]